MTDWSKFLRAPLLSTASLWTLIVMVGFVAGEISEAEVGTRYYHYPSGQWRQIGPIHETPRPVAPSYPHPQGYPAHQGYYPPSQRVPPSRPDYPVHQGITSPRPPSLAPSTSPTEASTCRGDCVSGAPVSSGFQAVATSLRDSGAQNLAVGARQTMAVIYQSCEVLNQEPYNRGRHGDISRLIQKVSNGHYNRRMVSAQNVPGLARQHFYLQHFQSSPPARPYCRDMRRTPPIYLYGGRAHFDNHNSVVDVTQTRRAGEATVTGIDCSAFAAAAMSAAGLKLRPSTQNVSQNDFTSRSLLGLNEHNSCLAAPTFTKGQAIQTGDMVAIPGHVMIIDRVSADPFGFQKMRAQGRFPRSAQECYRLQADPSLFNFTIIQSSAFGDMPAMITQGSHYLQPGTNMMNQFRGVVETACLAEWGHQPRVDKSRGAAILRHKGSADQRCVFPPDRRPMLKGQECTGDCLKEALQ